MATAAADVVGSKIEKIFNALDTDRDGHIDWSDFQRLIDGFTSEYQLNGNDRRTMALHASYAMFWQELVRHADADGDGRLSKDEYIAASRNAILDTSRFDAINGLTHAQFDLIDVDGDHQISQSEFNKMSTLWGISEPEMKESFQALDTDGDGHISRSELIRASREFFLSNDPSAPGSILFGRV
ncbi:EF-hand domain-containing protein [Streptomyces sp. bgisy100]|uniref:EF-hand domain-containing protein n=1 Tax=Streptomyces sp. bgisy100 TaxID=3413783 RepID=UPI003D74144F